MVSTSTFRVSVLVTETLTWSVPKSEKLSEI